jgi:uncharacterized protein involved in outer membrane biogenesis
VKKLLIGILVLLLLLVGGVLVAPSLIDWNRHKDEIALRVSAATGRTLTVEGDLDLNLLPRPTLRATGARLANLPGAVEPDMVRIGELQVQVALMPLLSGQVQVESVTLVEPVIALETLPDGRRNWEFGRQPGGVLDSVKLDQVRIVNGTVLYRDAADGAIERFEGIDASVLAGSLVGPFQVQAGLSARGVPLDVEVSAGRVGEGGAMPLRATVRLRGTETVLRFAGIATVGGSPRLQGDLRAEGQDLRRPLGAILTAAGRIPAGELPRGLQQPFNLRTALTASGRLVDLSGVELQVGETRGTGALKYRPAAAPPTPPAPAPAPAEGTSTPPSVPPSAPVDELEIGINVNRLDLDGLAALLRPAEGESAAPEGGNPAFTLPSDLRARFSVGVDALGFRGGVVRQARAEGELAGGTLALSRVSALLPGGSEVTVSGTVGAADGLPEMVLAVDAKADNLRALLDWLGVDVSRVPADRLRKFSLLGTLSGTPDQVQIAGMDLRLDTTVATGAVSYAERERPAFGARLEVDRLSLDAYFPLDKEGGRVFDPAWLDGFDATFEASVGSLVAAGLQVQGLRLDASLAAGSLVVRRMEAQDLAGAALSLGGTVGRLSPLDDLDLAFGASADSIAEPLRRLGLESPLPPERIGRVAVQGRLTGGPERIGIEAEATAAGGRLQAGGAVDRPLGEATLDLKLRGTWAQGMDLARLLWPGWRPAALGGVDLYAELGGSAGALSLSAIQGLVGDTPVTGEATVDLAGDRPVVEAQLSTGELVLDRFIEAPAAGAPPRGPLGAALAVEPPSGMELRLGLTARALVASGLRVEEAALRARAEPGALAVEQLDGAFRGGRLGLSGRVARPEPGRAEVTAKATVVGAALAEGLVPGQAPAQLDLDGRYDLTLEVAASGAAEPALLRGLDGRGRLSLRDGAVLGVDLGLLSGAALEEAHRGPAPARSLAALAQRAATGGRTPVSRLEAEFRVEDGVIVVPELALASPAGTASGQGRVDTVDRRVELAFEVQPAGAEGLPPLRLRAAGPIDAPQRSVSVEAVAEALASRARPVPPAQQPPAQQPATQQPPAAQPNTPPAPPSAQPAPAQPPAARPPAADRPAPRTQAPAGQQGSAARPAEAPEAPGEVVGGILDRLRR